MPNRNALPPLDLLVGFESAARHLSFTKAGEELHLTQSAVSRQIKELEDQLGVPLFQRRHRALALTDRGPPPCPRPCRTPASSLIPPRRRSPRPCAARPSGCAPRRAAASRCR